MRGGFRMKSRFLLHIKSYKLLYLFASTLIICGFVFGVILFNKQNSESVSSLSNFLNSIINIDYINDTSNIQSSLFSNCILLFVIFIFGLSIVGIPFVSFIVFTKGLQIGFSCALYLKSYAVKGFLGILLTLIPQIIFELFAVFILSVIAFEISLSIVLACFVEKKNVRIKEFLNHYLNFFILSLILVLISSLFKIYIVPILYKVFLI